MWIDARRDIVAPTALRGLVRLAKQGDRKVNSGQLGDGFHPELCTQPCFCLDACSTGGWYRRSGFAVFGFVDVPQHGVLWNCYDDSSSAGDCTSRRTDK